MSHRSAAKVVYYDISRVMDVVMDLSDAAVVVPFLWMLQPGARLNTGRVVVCSCACCIHGHHFLLLSVFKGFI